MSNSSIWLIDGTLSGASTPGQSGPGSEGNEGVHRILQNSSITGAWLSDYLVSYPRHLLGLGDITSLQRCFWCILQPQLTGLCDFEYQNNIQFFFILLMLVVLNLNLCKGRYILTSQCCFFFFMLYLLSIILACLVVGAWNTLTLFLLRGKTHSHITRKCPEYGTQLHGEALVL